jgi:hypothetical protein
MKWLSTVNRGPWTTFCQRSTVDSQQPIVIVETKCTITAIDGGQWTVDR